MTVPPAVRAIHDAFFAPRPRAAELYVAGVGRVGAAFLDQLSTRAVVHRLRVNGIASSRGAALERRGIDPSVWREALEDSSEPAEALIEAAIESPHHPRIFVDCTASPALPASYERMLAAGVSVVAANKIGFAATGAEWDRLREAAGRGGAIYYETTVGAGLPVLRTVSDLAATGDQILRLQRCSVRHTRLSVRRGDEGVPLQRGGERCVRFGIHRAGSARRPLRTRRRPQARDPRPLGWSPSWSPRTSRSSRSFPAKRPTGRSRRSGTGCRSWTSPWRGVAPTRRPRVGAWSTWARSRRVALGSALRLSRWSTRAGACMGART